MWEGGWESKSREDIGIFGFEKTKYERKWILCVREHTMDPTLPPLAFKGTAAAGTVLLVAAGGALLVAYVGVAVRWGDPATQGK